MGVRLLSDQFVTSSLPLPAGALPSGELQGPPPNPIAAISGSYGPSYGGFGGGHQLGPSDHVHFGQVVLYALESSADVIIWLVAVEPRWSGWVGLRPEHQRALERLNEVFACKIEFYGVDVNLPPAPLLADGLGPQPLPVITVAVKPSSALPRYQSSSIAAYGNLGLNT
jgi:hypothetical protein